MNRPVSPAENDPLLPEQDSQAQHGDSLRGRLLLLIFICVVAVDFGSYLSYAPQVAIFEDLICRQFYGSGEDGSVSSNGHGPLCKSPEVQGELALILGWKDTLDQVPGVVLAVFYGVISDRIGRKPILLLSLTGLILQEAVIIGGGSQIATSMAYAMLTNVYATKKRASIFFVLGAAVMTGEILATPIGAGLISRGAWIPYWVGFGVQLIGAVLAIAIPNQRSPRDDLSTTPEPIVTPSNLGDNGEAINDDRSSRIHWWPMGVLELNKNLLYALASFVLANVGRQALQLVIQYTSIKFSWSIARSSSLLTYKGIVTLVTLLLFLPKASLALNKRLTVMESDLIIVRLCITALMLGASIMAFAQEGRLFITGLTFFAIGWGFYSAMRSLAMSFAVPTQVGLVNTLIALAQSTGTVIAGPLLAAAFRKGIILDGFMFGLPYMVAASFFLGATVLIFCMIGVPQDRAETV